MFKTWAMVTACVCTFGLIGKVVGEPVGEFVLSEYATATPELAPSAAESELNYVEARGEGLASQPSGLTPSRPSASVLAGLSGTHLGKLEVESWFNPVSFSSLLLFFCLVLMVGIAYSTRQLHKLNTELGRRSLELERRGLDLGGSNEQLKREIGERRRMETELRASENFYASLVETVPQNIFRKDLAGRYTFANRALCATLGKAPGEITGKTDHDFFAADLAARFQKEDEQVLAGNKQVEIEQIYPTRTRGRICVQMIKTPLFDSDGRPIGLQGIFWDVTERKRAGQELESAHRQLIDASRRVGMAEVATGVLHNVGNVLNSVNVSATLVCEQVQRSKVTSLGKVAALLSEHADVPGFLIEDKRGQQLPGYLKDLAEHLRKEQATMLRELDSLVKNIEHIKEIVYMQQAYAKLSGLNVAVKASEIVEDALRMNSSALTRHDVQVLREYQEDPILVVDKHQILQSLVNLIRNAKYACDESGRPSKQIRLRIGRHGDDRVRIQVVDNGVGIPRENLGRLFTRGFTTRADGHGFGLHSSLMVAREMGGTLTAHSDGPGQGAIFTLELPLQPKVPPQ